MVGEVSTQFFQSRLDPDAATQTLRAVIRKPRLRYMAIGHHEAITHIKAAAGKLKLRDCRAAFRCLGGWVAAILDCGAAFISLRFRITERTSSA